MAIPILTPLFLKKLLSGFAKTLFTTQASPFVGLIIGILATGLFQSSSTTTSLVVGMVAGGIFGDDPIIAVSAAVPYIMGANIGTSITNTIVSMGHIGDKIEFSEKIQKSVNFEFSLKNPRLEEIPSFLSRSESGNKITAEFIAQPHFEHVPFALESRYIAERYGHIR